VRRTSEAQRVLTTVLMMRGKRWGCHGGGRGTLFCQKHSTNQPATTRIKKKQERGVKDTDAINSISLVLLLGDEAGKGGCRANDHFNRDQYKRADEKKRDSGLYSTSGVSR